jgi:hypothetical protein
MIVVGTHLTLERFFFLLYNHCWLKHQQLLPQYFFAGQ